MFKIKYLIVYWCKFWSFWSLPNDLECLFQVKDSTAMWGQRKDIHSSSAKYFHSAEFTKSCWKIMRRARMDLLPPSGRKNKVIASNWGQLFRICPFMNHSLFCTSVCREWWSLIWWSLSLGTKLEYNVNKSPVDCRAKCQHSLSHPTVKLKFSISQACIFLGWETAMSTKGECKQTKTELCFTTQDEHDQVYTRCLEFFPYKSLILCKITDSGILHI